MSPRLPDDRPTGPAANGDPAPANPAKIKNPPASANGKKAGSRDTAGPDTESRDAGSWPDPVPAPDGQLPLNATVPADPNGGKPARRRTPRHKHPSPNGARSRNGKGGAPASRNGSNGRRAPAPAAVYVDHSDLLPTAHPADGGMLATLLGFDERPARFVTAVGENGWENPTAPQSAWDLLPSLDDVAPDQEAPTGRDGNTGDAVKRLWDATEQMDLSPRRNPDHLQPVDHLNRRRMRWPLILGVLVILAGGVFVGRELTSRSTQAVTARQAEHIAAAENLDSTLQPLELRLASITAQGGLDEAVLSGLAGELGRLDGAARQTLALAGQALPDSPLLGSSASRGEELTAEQETLGRVSTRALIVEQRLAAMVAYAQPYSRAFNLPEMPERAASSAELDAITGALNRTFVESRDVLDDLPDNPDFTAHRKDALSYMALLENGQNDYVTALRSGDEAGAGAAARNIKQLTITLDQSLAWQRGPVLEWAQGEIGDLRSQLRLTAAE